ncbi:MAG: endonuclease III [Candidatus Diapherotrites archaeon]|nr:endonuclease III [Candidatus Diapherotrites archaeon]
MNVQRKAQWKTIFRILRKNYPNLKIGLTQWKNPFELTISTILSAQCTDARVNLVTKSLFKKYRKPTDYLKVAPEELELDIRSTGFYKNKTKNIRGLCTRLISHYGGNIPERMEELITLPGVGRKTANIVLFAGFNKKEGIAVDTHVFRVSKRLGLAEGKTPEKVERQLMEIVDKKDWGNLTNYLIGHGRKICVAQKPRCSICPLTKICPRVGVTKWA